MFIAPSDTQLNFVTYNNTTKVTTSITSTVNVNMGW